MRLLNLGTTILVFLALSTSAAQAANEKTGHLGVEGGRSYPQGEAATWLDPGPAFRTDIFGGVKINIGPGGAAGLGLDFTYAQYNTKNEDGGRYRRYLWDWFFLPIGIGYLNVTPGLAWVVTDVRLPSIDLEETSIRPAAVLSVGLNIPVMQHLALVVDVRGEKVLIDKERIDANHELNITGDFITAVVGIEARF